MSNPSNIMLLIGGTLSIIASLTHVAIIFGGPAWYRFFGAGERMALMAERGELYPTLITLAIASVLFTWGLYAFSGAGLILKLPLLAPALFAISSVYVLRGLAFIPIYLLRPDIMSPFWLWSSLICLTFGLIHTAGTWLAWPSL
ncbi:hypothetical protein [Kordiimonas sp.]|uniref:hypothetical protein n=1 Tax=Kordiimonas sp. TaxID=1970157 RepID=UPI003A9535D4